MSSQWRGGPKVKGTLGTLLRTTMHQVGVVKDAAVRQARTQRVWIDGAVLARRRKDLLAQIGERVVARVRAGDAEVALSWPELLEDIDELDALEAELEEASARSREAVPAVSAVSSAWSKRSAAPAPARRPEDLRVWRPVVDEADGEAGDGEPGAQGAGPPEPQERGARRTSRLSPKGRGGIAFADDPIGEDDLEEYMHDDDIPDEGTR